MIPETNYSSGEDYEIEFLGYRFAFNAFDFEQRVTAAAVKLGLVESNELDEDETADLVELVHRGLIDEPRSGLGRYVVRHWERVSLVVGAATIAEVTGSILWGVYRYRMHNLPLFVPPGHGLVYLSGVGLSQTLRRHARALVGAAAAGAVLWGLLGLTVLPRLDVAGALGVPLLLLFLWRSESRAAYAGVFVVVAILELYGTAIGTWRWTEALPGLGIPDGNPPSGAASGYVCFDVAALLLAPRLLALRTRLPAPAPAQP